MSIPNIAVSGVNLPFIEYQGQPVVTFAMIDAAHSRPERTARRNFTANKQHFIEGEDFYRVDFKRWHEFRATYSELFPESTTRLTLFTETGYLMLVKSFTDDLAWQVQRQLVKSYFRVTGAIQPTAAPPVPEPITSHQRDAMAKTLNDIFAPFQGYRQSGTARLYNRLRVQYHLKRIEDLSQDDYPAAMEVVEAQRDNVARYRELTNYLQNAFFTEVVGNGECWTAWLSRQVGGAHKVGKKPDWPRLARQVLKHHGLLDTKH